MERERWIQVRDLLHDLLEQDSTERKRLLDLVGATDPELRREAESLLKFENEDVLDKTAIGAKRRCHLAEHRRLFGSPASLGERTKCKKLPRRHIPELLGAVAASGDEEFEVCCERMRES